ncbi:MAG: TIGR01244 family sulfur transferase, partial [Paracoccus sp. (in: a-proteobacteria)]|nr:TIGR01244 family sulfur transferase [Paracoccus sp. (in: a-proteobacteria)]
MDLRQISPTLAVSPQIRPEDMATLAAAGFTTVVNNRPDSEVDDDHDDKAMRAAAEAAGLRYYHIPFVPGEITPQMIADFAAATADQGPTIAYCRTGNRSTVLWALNQAGKLPEEEIMATAQAAGYDLSPV